MGGMSLRIRPAGPPDLDLIEAIENDADRLLIERFQPDSWPPAPAGAARLAEPGFVLVAETDAGQVVGFVHVIETDGIAHLEQISVSPAHGRHGYGRVLLDAATAHARARGCARMTLRTYADVPWNAPFYARAGFAEEEAMTPFHLALIETETTLGLEKHGRRVQMGVDLR